VVPMHFVMEQRMLQGIRERAEGRPVVTPLLEAAAHVGWFVGAFTLAVVFLVRRQWRPWFLLAIALVLPSMSLTGEIDAALAGFLAFGITLIGFLAFGWHWLPPYLLLASAIALVLLLAAGSYTAFGLIFLTVGAALAVAHRSRLEPQIRSTVIAARERAPGDLIRDLLDHGPTDHGAEFSCKARAVSRCRPLVLASTRAIPSDRGPVCSSPFF
jgi:hypothetical protein